MKNGPIDILPSRGGLGTNSDVSRPQPSDLSGITVAVPYPQQLRADNLAAMLLAKDEAQGRLGDCMLPSWYDRDRDFEAPQHMSECHQASAVPGYVDCARHRGATLKIDIESGRFVFFYRRVDF
jgi:hypothetical protein